MPETAPSSELERAASATAIGTLLKDWRRTRGLSQLSLATEADVSPRHLSFVETGRAKPSREMVVLLSTVLRVPLRERNVLLLAAGYAPVYREARLDAPELGPVSRALAAILRQQEPFPAVVMNRHWDILDMNQGAQRFFGLLLGAGAPRQPMNVLRLMFDPNAMRPHVENWHAVAESLLQRLHREATGGVKDDVTLALLAEVLAYPGVPPELRRPNLAAPLSPVQPVRFRHGTTIYDFFSTVTTLGTPQDVTLEELRIECFFPTGPETERLTRELASAAASTADDGPTRVAGSPVGG